MKALLVILSLCAVTVQAQFQNTIAFRGASSTVPSGGSTPTCQTLVADTGYNSGNTYGQVNYSQKIKGHAGGDTICGAGFIANDPGRYHCEVWSGVNGTGTQYGTASGSVTIAGGVFYDFTWSVNPVTPENTDYYLVFVHEADGGVTQFSGDVYNTGQGYVSFEGTTPTGLGCLRFYLNTMQ